VAAGPTTTAGATTSATDVSLAGDCPATIVVQTDWNPEADHFAYYELAAPDGTVDTNKKTYTAELLAHGGKDTGVKIQIRSGGPAVGSQLDSALMYEDQSILLGFVQTDEAIQLSQSQPTVAIVASRLNTPTIIMWDPASHPNDKTIADLGKDGTRVLYFNGAPYMDYLVGSGILKKSQVDGSYKGQPAQFVASNGAVAQQGFATAEPYEYQHEITQWMKPVTYQLVSATGYAPYPAIATRPENITKYAACFKKLVPIIQQGIVDYAADPAAANALIVKLVTQYNNGWVYSAGEAAAAATAQVSQKIIANSPNGQLGDFDFTRIQKLMDIVTPIYSAAGKTIKSGLTPQDITTNQFIDPSIHLPAG
jgi:ABC-type nitrate/sulfonate/bicarbonate transport system substrate-binding protein